MDKGGLGLLFYAYLKNQVVCSVVSKENQTKYFFSGGRTNRTNISSTSREDIIFLYNSMYNKTKPVEYFTYSM